MWRAIQQHSCLVRSLLLALALACNLPTACTRHTAVANRTGTPALGPRSHSLQHNGTWTDTRNMQVNDHRTHCPLGEFAGPDKARRLEAFKKDILTKLGMEDQTSRRNPALRQQGTLADENHEPVHADQVVIFAVPGDDGNLYFNLTDRIRYDTVDRSYLHIYILGKGNQDRPLAVSLAVHARGYSAMQLIAERTAYLAKNEPGPVFSRWNASAGEPAWKVSFSENGHWVRFRMDKILQYWLVDINRERVLKVEAVDDQGNNWAIVRPAPDEKDFGVYLQVQLRGQEMREEHIMPRDCREETTAGQCCRCPLTVNFSELGLDFIVHPPLYDAYYCSSDCRQDTALTSYSVIAPRHDHNVSGTGSGPTSTVSKVGACCAARTAEDIVDMDLMYMTPDGSMVIAKLPGMSVLRCGFS